MKCHDIVRFREDYRGVLSGTVGTIVYVYLCKSAFEVELKVGSTSKVVTVDNTKILEVIKK